MNVRKSERGAVLTHAVVAMIGLLAMSTFAVDYGVLWTARRQAQNSADAGALAGAISLGFVDADDKELARESALGMARQNRVWGIVPDVLPGDITFPLCPPGSPAEGEDACIRVNVFRNQREAGSPLPTFFGNLVGVTDQGVRATATAQVLFGASTDCNLPFAIPDKWVEMNPKPSPFSPDDEFLRYDPKTGALLDPADYYRAPSGDDPGTGYTRESTEFGGADHGLQVTLKFSDPKDATAPGWYQVVSLNPEDPPGMDSVREDILGCDDRVIGPGDLLTVKDGNMRVPVARAIDELVSRDSGASWDPNLYGPGKGGISGGCMSTGACTVSPRLRPVPVYNPDAYDARRRESGRLDLEIVKVIGFFIDRATSDHEIIGYITSYPSEPFGGEDVDKAAAFVISIALVR